MTVDVIGRDLVNSSEANVDHQSDTRLYGMKCDSAELFEFLNEMQKQLFATCGLAREKSFDGVLAARVREVSVNKLRVAFWAFPHI